MQQAGGGLVERATAEFVRTAEQADQRVEATARVTQFGVKVIEKQERPDAVDPGRWVAEYATFLCTTFSHLIEGIIEAFVADAPCSVQQFQAVVLRESLCDPVIPVFWWTAGGDVDMRESYSSYLERSVAGDEMTDALPDIDLYDHDNPLAVTEYVNDIYDYWYRVEVRMRVQRLYGARRRVALRLCVSSCAPNAIVYVV